MHQFREEIDDAVAQQLRLCPAVRHQLPDIFTVALQRQLPVFNVTANAGELRSTAAPPFLHQREAGIHRTADGSRTGDAIEHIVSALLAQMMDQQNGDAVGIRDLFQSREVTVVVGVGSVAYRAYHLQSVDNDQHRVRVFVKEGAELFLQSFAQNVALGGEVDIGGSILRDFEQPVLNAEGGVLQAEIEGGALLHGHPPDGFALGHHDGQPQGQPGFSHLGRAGKDVQPLRQQRVHHEVEWCQRQAHQALTVDGLQSFCFTHRIIPL